MVGRLNIFCSSVATKGYDNFNNHPADDLTASNTNEPTSKSELPQAEKSDEHTHDDTNKNVEVVTDADLINLNPAPHSPLADHLAPGQMKKAEEDPNACNPKEESHVPVVQNQPMLYLAKERHIKP